MFTSPTPDVEIPEVGVYDFLFASLDRPRADRDRADRSRLGCRDDLRRPARPGERVRRSARRTRRRHRHRGRTALPERARVRDGVPRHPAGGCDGHDDQLALHRGRDREAAEGCRGHMAHHGDASARAGEGRGIRRRHRRRPPHRPRRFAGPPEPARAAHRAEPRARGELRPRDARRGAPLLVRHDRNPQGRDAHAPQPGRQRAAVPARTSISATPIACSRCCRSSTSTA